MKLGFLISKDLKSKQWVFPYHLEDFTMFYWWNQKENVNDCRNVHCALPVLGGGCFLWAV